MNRGWVASGLTTGVTYRVAPTLGNSIAAVRSALNRESGVRIPVPQPQSVIDRYYARLGRASSRFDSCHSDMIAISIESRIVLTLALRKRTV